MKKLLLFLPVLYLFSCEKKNAGTSQPSPLIDQAKSYFTDSILGHGDPVNYRAAQPKTVCWDQAQVIAVGTGQGVLVPIVYAGPIMVKANFAGDFLYHLSYLTQLLVYQDSALRLQARVITSFPDSAYFKNPQQKFTGIKFIEDWDGDIMEKLLYQGGSIKRYVASTKMVESYVVETCYTIFGYNAGADGSEEEDWSEDAGCELQFPTPVDGGGDPVAVAAGDNTGGGGSAASASTSAAFEIAPPGSIIQSVSNYFNCFTNVGGSDHTYTVTVCIDQPQPGTRTAWTVTPGGLNGSTQANNLVDVGHTFLTLTEVYGNTIVNRNIGFYPAVDVTPLTPSAQAQFGNDQTHPYNISASFALTNAEFFTVLNFITQYSEPGYEYNLNTNNCTTFVINTMAQVGVDLPRTVGTWARGSGNDPGDLGEDIQSANIPGMTLNLNGGTGSSHLDAGQCN